MAALVVAEHDNRALKPATLNAVAAANEIAAPEVDILVAGKDCRAVAEAAAKIAGAPFRQAAGVLLAAARPSTVLIPRVACGCAGPASSGAGPG